MPAFDPYAPLREGRGARLVGVLGSPDLRLPTNIKRLALGADAEQVLVADDEGALTVWDLSLGAEVGVLPRAQTGGVRGVAFAGAGVVFVDGAGGVQRWDPKAGRVEPVLKAGAADGRRSVFSADGNLLAVGFDDQLKLFDLKKRKEVRTFPCEDGLHHLAISADGKRLLGSTYDNTLRLFEVGKGTQQELPVKLGSVLAICFAGPSHAAVAGEQNLTLWELTAKGKKKVLHQGSWESYAMALSASARGGHLAAGFNSGVVRVWSLKTLKLLLDRAHTDDVRTALAEDDGFPQGEKVESVALSADGAIVASAAQGSVRLYDVARREELRPACAHKARVAGLGLLPGGELWTAGEDGLFAVRELKTGKALRELEPKSPLHAVVARGSLAFLGRRGAIESWDLAKGKKKGSIAVRRMNVDDRVDSLALSAEGEALVSGSAAGFIEVWEPKGGKLLRQYKTRDDDVIAALAVGGPGWILAGDNKGRLRLLELVSGEELASLPAHKQRILSVALSPDGRRAVSATPTEMTLWELQLSAGGPVLKAVHGLKDLEPCAARPVCISADGRTLFVGGRALRVLDAHSGREIDRLDLRGARDAATALFPTEDGATLLLGTMRGVTLSLSLAGLPAALGKGPEALPVKAVAKGPFAALAGLAGDSLQEALAHHFAPWAITPACQDVLARLLARVQGCETSEAGDLIVAFRADEGAPASLTLAPPFKGKAAPGTVLPPKSFWDVVRLHNGVRFARGPSAGLELSGYDEEEGVLCALPLTELGGNPGKQLGFCDAGSGWFFFDLKKRNKLSEPAICLAQGESAFAKARLFPDQERTAFGTGGFLLRSLAQRVLSKDKALTTFAVG